MTVGSAAELETAILDRARALAAEHAQQGRQVAERIARESEDRLARREARERAAAEAEAQREYRRVVQAEELRLHAAIDRLCGGLVESALDAVARRLEEIATDGPQYRDHLLALLRAAVAALPREERLVGYLNERDRRRLVPEWDALVEAACPDREVALGEQALACSGGLSVTTADGDVRVDQTFEARLERHGPALRRLLHERLFVEAASGELAFHG